MTELRLFATAGKASQYEMAGVVWAPSIIPLRSEIQKVTIATRGSDPVSSPSCEEVM